MLPEKYDPKLTKEHLARVAERVVFTDDIPSMLYQMHDNKQLTFDGVLSSVRMPYDCFWLEYKTECGMGEIQIGDPECINMGALLHKIEGGGVRMYIVTGLKWPDFDMMSTLTFIVQFSQWPPRMLEDGKTGMFFSVIYAFNWEKIEKQVPRAIMELGNIIMEIIFGVF